MHESEVADGPMTLGLSGELLARVDVLVERLQDSDLSRHLHVTRELVLRLALLHGIEQLEEEVRG
jgi:hypothetical protein